MKLFLIAFVVLIAACSDTEVSTNSTGNSELWVLVKLDTEFRSEDNLAMVDEITKIVEGEGLGSLDGHSSGGHQLEFNYGGIKDWEKAKSVIDKSIRSIYPDVEYTISNAYETIYEKL